MFRNYGSCSTGCKIRKGWLTGFMSLCSKLPECVSLGKSMPNATFLKKKFKDSQDSSNYDFRNKPGKCNQVFIVKAQEIRRQIKEPTLIILLHLVILHPLC